MPLEMHDHSRREYLPHLDHITIELLINDRYYMHYEISDHYQHEYLPHVDHITIELLLNDCSWLPLETLHCSRHVDSYDQMDDPHGRHLYTNTNYNSYQITPIHRTNNHI